MAPTAKKAAQRVPSLAALPSPNGPALPRELLELLENERGEVARLLHAQLGQQLTAAVLLLNLLHKDVADARDSQLTSVTRLTDLLTEARRQLREVMQILQPVGEASDGLVLALTDFLRQSGEKFGVDCRLECPQPVLVESPVTGSVLFRVAEQIVQSALAGRQSGKIVVNLSQGAESIVLDISSFERESHPPAIQAEATAISAAQLRVAAMGGTLSQERLPCCETRVRCLIPYSSNSSRRI